MLSDRFKAACVQPLDAQLSHTTCQSSKMLGASKEITLVGMDYVIDTVGEEKTTIIRRNRNLGFLEVTTVVIDEHLVTTG